MLKNNKAPDEDMIEAELLMKKEETIVNDIRELIKIWRINKYRNNGE